MAEKQKTIGHQSGFTLIELLVVVVILAIVVTFSVMRIGSARASINLNNSAKTLVNYLEKARVDSIRRHPMENSQKARILVIDSTNYQVTMDFGGNGVLSTRNVTLENGVSFVIPTEPGPTAGTTVQIKPNPTFDWRGYNEGGDSFVFTNGATQVSVSVSDSGDVTLNNSSNPVTIPTPIYNKSINGSTEIKSETIVNPSSKGCTIATNTASVTVARNKTVTVTVTLGSAVGMTNTVSASTTSSLITITPTSRNITGNGSIDFTIKAGKKSGYYAVTFSSPCG